MFLELFSLKTHTNKPQLFLQSSYCHSISSAALAAFVWDLNITVVVILTKWGRNSEYSCKSVGAEEDLGSVTGERLDDELKPVFGVSVIFY